MKIKPFRAYFPRFSAIASPDTFCSGAKNEFTELMEKGFFDKTSENAFYVYQIESITGKHTGLVASNMLEDYIEHKIKKHEHTLSDKETSQIRLFIQWRALLKPVLLSYPEVPAIEQWMQAFIAQNLPFVSVRFVKDNQNHRIWAVTAAEDIAHLQYLFEANVPVTYIADGHHRTATLAFMQQNLQHNYPDFDFNHLLCAYFSTAQLDILDYNRVIQAPDDLEPERFLQELSTIFELTALNEPAKPSEKHSFMMVLDQQWYQLVLKKELLDQYPADQVLLDAYLLNKWVLNKILGIEDARTDTKITYVEGSKGLAGIEKSMAEPGKRIGFMLYPVDFDDLIHLADLGESLPPKSTYFEPRLKTAMLVKLLTDHAG
jgi:uncharacterized protein (DUF1015 family)